MPQVPERVLDLGDLEGKEVNPLPPLMYQGLTVFLTDGGSLRPTRVHSRNANQGKHSYHHRIQKKWLKRFGQHWVEIQARGQVFQLGRHSIIVRRDDWDAFQRG